MKERMSASLDIEQIEWLDEMAERMNCSRSMILGICIDAGRDNFKLLSMVGVKPEHAVVAAEYFKKMQDALSSEVGKWEAV